MREYLFEYHFGGETWGITIHAINDEQARRKIKAVGMARYQGEVHMKVGLSWVDWLLSKIRRR